MPTASKPSPIAAAVAGEATVYFFFSTSCEYCAAQAPDMQQFYRQNPNVRVVGVPLYASQSDAQSFARRYGMTFEVRQDPSLVQALGSVSKHPVIALQRSTGGSLTRASNGTISVSALKSSYDTFAKGGQPVTNSGSG